MAGAASATLALDASQPGLFGAALKPQWWSGSQSLRAQEHCKGPYTAMDMPGVRVFTSAQ